MKIQQRLWIAIVAVIAAGCGMESPEQNRGDLTRGPRSEQVEAHPEAVPNAADRMANGREADLGTTAQDQGSSTPDETITQHIRSAIVGDGRLGLRAKNVAIVTVDRAVTLRGDVDNADERAVIDSIVQHESGVQSVRNLIEIAPN